MTTEIKCTCPWLDTTKLDYVKYHDEEWGVPIFDDNKLFECLILESAQAGLSWYTILKKREGYRELFSNFNVGKVAKFSLADEQRLVLDARIIRHKGKISATVTNAQRFITIQREFGSFAKYLWAFVDDKVNVSSLNVLSDYPATNHLSNALSKDLRKRGFKFVGPTTMYAYLQATGLINDHSNNCSRKCEIVDSYKTLGLRYVQT